jgi:molecular chaperone GrpE
MADKPHETGSFRVDIPQEAIDAAMRSVEKRGGAEDDPGATGNPPALAGDGNAPPATPPGDGNGAPPESPEAQTIRKLETMLAESQKLGAITQERLKETADRWVRTQADLENLRKRNDRQREEVQKFANERLLKDILPIVDNLERALSSSADGASLLEGVRLVLRQFADVLTRNGVKAFSAVGEPFDPSRHEALMQQESDLPPNTVVSEMAKGYLLHDRLVRPAAVVVSKGRPAEPAPPAAAPGQPGEPASPDSGPA